MKLIKSINSNTSNIKKFRLSSGEEIAFVQTYQGKPEELKKHEESLGKIFEKYTKGKGDTLRQECVIEGNLMHIGVIRTTSGAKMKKLDKEVNDMKEKNKPNEE